MSKKGSIRYQIKTQLQSMLCLGRSRHEDKINGISTYDKIYSWGTINTYIKQLNYMVDWANKNNLKLKNIDDIKNNGDKWLQDCLEQGMSAWTLTTRRAALCKLCQVPYSYFKTQIPKRRRADVKRSRDMSLSMKYYNYENNKNQIIFSRCTGLRLSELKEIRGTDLVFNEQGDAFLHITKGTKGGKHRTAQIVGNEEEIELVIRLLKNAKKDKVFDHINTHINTHGLRADYCQRVYNLYSRDVETLTRKEKVFCRRDKKGVVYDRNALYICNKYLGHNRSEIANINYLY